MQLTDAQVERFDRDGFLVLPGLIAEAEVGVLRRDLQRLCEGDREGTSREDNGTLRVVWRFHEADGSTASPPFRALSRVPRLVEPAKQLLRDDDVYIFHSKANVKSAIDGTMWTWHQDYANWLVDGVPTSNMVTFLVFLEDITEISGCLYFVPGSHKLGTIEQRPADSVPRVSVPKARMLEILRDFPAPVAMTGTAGTAVIFHSDLVHASGHNLSGNDRWQIYFVYNPVANKPVPPEKPRAEMFVSRNYAPLVAVPDESVLAAPLPG